MQTNESFLWNRNNSYSTYLKILAHYQAISIFENKKGNNLLDIGSNDGYILIYYPQIFLKLLV